MLKQIQRTMEQLSAKLDHVQNLWRDKEWEVSGHMQVSELEQGMKTVSGRTDLPRSVCLLTRSLSVSHVAETWQVDWQAQTDGSLG